MGIIKLQSGGVLSQPLAKQQFKSIYGKYPSGASDYVKVADIQSNPSKYGLKAGMLPSIEITAKSEVKPTIIGKHYAAQKEANRQHNFIPSNKGLVPNPDAKRGIEQSDIDLALIGGGLTGRGVKMIQGLLPKATTKLGKVAVGLGKEGIEEVGNMVNPLSGVFNPEIKGNVPDAGKPSGAFDPLFYKLMKSYLEPNIKDPSLLSTYSNFKDRINSPEGVRRAEALGLNNTDLNFLNNIKLKQLKKDPHNAHFWDSTIRIGDSVSERGYHPNDVLRHELEHGVQNYKATSIDDDLERLDLKYGVYPLEEWKRQNPGKHYNASFNAPILDQELVTDYFSNGSEGLERSAFLGELQEQMVRKGIKKHAYETFTPQDIEGFYNSYTKDKDATNLRILNIIKPTNSNFSIIASNLNKMLTPTGLGLGLGYGLSQTEKKRSGGVLKFQQSGTISKDTASAHFKNLYGRNPSGAGDAIKLQQIIQNPSKFGIKQNVLPGVEVSAESLVEPGVMERYFAAQKGKLKSNEMVGGKANPTADKMEPVDWEMALMPSRGLSKVLLSNMAKSRIARIAVEGIDMIDPTSMGMGLAKAAKQYEVKPIKGVASMGFPFEIRKKADNQLALPNPNNQFNPEIKEYKDNYEMFKDFNEQGKKQGIVIDRDSDEYQDYLANAHKSREYYVGRDIEMLKPRVEAGAGSYRNIGREGLKPYNLEDPLDARSLGFLHGERLDDWKNRQLALAYKRYTPEWLGHKIDQASIDKGLGIDNPSEGLLKHLEEDLTMKPRLHKDLKSLSTEREKLINDSPSVSYDDRVVLSSSGNPEDISLLNHIDDASRSKEARLQQLQANEAMIKSSSLLTKLGIKENPYKEYLKGSKQVGDWVSPSNRLSNEDIADGLWLSKRGFHGEGSRNIDYVSDNFGKSNYVEISPSRPNPVKIDRFLNYGRIRDTYDSIDETNRYLSQLNDPTSLRRKMLERSGMLEGYLNYFGNKRIELDERLVEKGINLNPRQHDYDLPSPVKVLNRDKWGVSNKSLPSITKSMNREHLGKWDLTNPDWHKALLPMGLGLGLGYKSLNKEDK